VHIEADGFSGNVHVRDDGRRDAPVLLLLIHGFSGSMHWYQALVDQLVDDYRVIRVDLAGHGETRGAAADAPVQARIVDSVLEALDTTGVTAIGHSFGADVAVELGERSARVDRIVVLAQAPDYTDANLPRGRALMTVPRLNRALHRSFLGLGTAINATLGSRRSVADRQLARQALRDFGALDTAMFGVVLVQRRDRMALRPLDEQLRAAGKPALVVLGGKDHFYGARSAERYRSAGAQVAVLPDSGHSVQLDAPAETAQLIKAFDPPTP